MAKTKLFLACYIGFLVYIISRSLFGVGGLVDYAALLQYRDRLNKNLIELAGIYDDLYHDLQSLQSNAEMVKLFGREMGYFAKDEYVVKFPGLKQRKSFYKVGTVLKRNQETNNENQFIFICTGLAVGLLIYLFSTIFSDRKKSRYGHRKK
jgi:hypothetical protein